MAGADDYPTTEEGWDQLRAYFDAVGQRSLDDLIKEGRVPVEIAGQRIAHFNDGLIEQLRKKADELRSGQAGRTDI